MTTDTPQTFARYIEHLKLLYEQAYAAGFRAGEHKLCPRCGVELDAECAAEEGEAP